MENKNRPREVNDSVKCNYISIIGLSEEEGREKEAESLFKEIIAEDLPNLGKKTVFRSSRYRELLSKSTEAPRHTVIEICRMCGWLSS